MNRPDPHESLDILESTHQFPCAYTFKAIGVADDDFENRVVQAVSACLNAPADLTHSVRTTQGKRHAAVTLSVTVINAEQILAVYKAIQGVPGLVLRL